jgi:alpha-tubulin suppressor-like RCC1 family protein
MQALQVAAGGMHTVALADDGTVWSWGVNDEGALGRQTAGELWEKASERVGRQCAVLQICTVGHHFKACW